MIGFIKTLFAAIFGVIGAILKLPLTLLSLPAKLLSSGNGNSAEATPKKKKGEAFFLEADDAKGTPASATQPQAKPQPAAVAATANALNLPQPTVTATPAPANDYKAFASRRRPGANMKSYLDMAKGMKNA